MVGPESSKKNRVDQWIDGAKNNRILSVIIFVAIVLGALASFSESVRTLLNLGSSDKERPVVVMTEYASKLLRRVVSGQNEDAWVYIVNVPESAPAALYREALTRELRRIVSRVKFVNQESIDSQLSFMKSARFDEPTDVWGTALVVVDVAKDSMEIAQRPDRSHTIDRVFVAPE